MLIRIVLAGLLAIVIPGVARAAAVTRPPWAAIGTQPQRVINTAPLNLLLGVLSVEYEHVANERFTFYAAPVLGFPQPMYLTFDSTGDVQPHFAGLQLTTLKSAGANVGLRFFPLPMDSAPAGLWLGTQLRAEVGNLDSSSIWTLTGAVTGMVGYTWLLGPLALSAAIGSDLGYTGALALTPNVPAGTYLVEVFPVPRTLGAFRLPTGRFNIGYAF